MSPDSSYQYVWDAVRTNIVEQVDHDHVRCPHRSWSVWKEADCHDCAEAGLARLVAEGARDDEILPAFSAWPIPERRWMEAALSRLRGAQAADQLILTAWQRDKIAKIPDIAARLRRSSKRGATVAAIAREIEVDRGTLAAWIKRGLVTL